VPAGGNDGDDTSRRDGDMNNAAGTNLHYQHGFLHPRALICILAVKTIGADTRPNEVQCTSCAMSYLDGRTKKHSDRWMHRQPAIERLIDKFLHSVVRGILISDIGDSSSFFTFT